MFSLVTIELQDCYPSILKQTPSQEQLTITNLYDTLSFDININEIRNRISLHNVFNMATIHIAILQQRNACGSYFFLFLSRPK